MRRQDVAVIRAANGAYLRIRSSIPTPDYDPFATMVLRTMLNSNK